MRHRPVRYTLNVLLLAAAVVVVLTGFVVDRLDLNDFTPHRWAGYAVALLIAVHVAQRWRWLLPPRWTDRNGREREAAASIATGAGPDVRSIVPIGDGDRDGGGSGPYGEDAPGGGAAPREPANVPPAPAHPTRRTAIAAAGAGMAGAVLGWAAKSEVTPTPYTGGDVGLFYHRESSLGLRNLLRGLFDWGARPAPYLRVGNGAAVALPAVPAAPAMSVAEALQQRRSLRSYADRAMTGQELAWVIQAATGITSASGHRTAPSAGALYPLETYVAVNRVEGIDAGVYHVDVRAQALEPVRSGSVAGDLMVAGLGQDFLRRAQVVLVITGLFQRSRWKYRERHYRYVCWEGGHVAQNVYLAAESVGMGACMVGGFLDGMVNDLVAVDGRHEAALGLIALGPRSDPGPS